MTTMTQYPRKLALPPFVAAVALVWFLLYLHPSHRHDSWDTALAVLLAVGWTIGVVFQLIDTEGWTVRALGVFGAVAGDAVIYSYVAGSGWDGRYFSTGVLEGILDLGRALATVGMPLFIVGVGWTIVLRRRARAQATPTPHDPRSIGVPERTQQ